MPTNHTHVSLHVFKKRIAKRDIDIIQFLLVNIFICKDVIVRIVRYIIRLLPKIQQAITDYNERKNNRLIRIFDEFTGYCNNISLVISEYLFFKRNRFNGVVGPRIMELPSMDKIRECKSVWPRLRMASMFLCHRLD
jgi:hypothetical protein